MPVMVLLLLSKEQKKLLHGTWLSIGLDSDAVAGFASAAVMKLSHQELSSSGAGMTLLSETLSHQRMYSSPPKAPCCKPEGQPLQAKQENSKFKFHFITCYSDPRPR